MRVGQHREHAIADCVQSFASITSADGYKSMLSNLGPDLKEPTLRLVSLLEDLEMVHVQRS